MFANIFFSDVSVLCNESDSADSEDDSDWKEFDIDDDGTGHLSCLFCPAVFGTVSEAVSHCYIDHHFDLVKLKKRFNMDCYGYIKLVNFIRAHCPDACLVMSATEPIWEKEEYMKPVKPDDPWLMYGKLKKNFIYIVSQEEWTKLRESVPYVKIYRYNPKHLCPKLNGQRKVWSFCSSTYCAWFA